RERFDEAEHYFRQSHEIAERAGDAYLGGLCLVNHAKVHVARDRYEDARRDAEAALAVFDQLGVGSAKADAYRVLGMIYRETGRPALAESRLKSAIELAVGAGSVLNEAEASRELALLYQAMGRNQEALSLLNAAHRLFGRLDARAHLVHVAGKMAELEAAYLAVVREWGQSLESADTYTFGHCERVARLSVAVARTRDGRARADDGPVRRLSPRSWKGPRPARDSQQARPADARRVRGGPDASDLGDRAAREGRVPVGYQDRHPLAPRALRRDGLSRPPLRRRDPGRGAD